MSHEYESFRRVAYGDDGEDRAQFVPVCIKCSRFVKADESVRIYDPDAPNATCKKCGRVSMLFEGYL